MRACLSLRYFMKRDFVKKRNVNKKKRQTRPSCLKSKNPKQISLSQRLVVFNFLWDFGLWTLDLGVSSNVWVFNQSISDDDRLLRVHDHVQSHRRWLCVHQRPQRQMSG